MSDVRLVAIASLGSLLAVFEEWVGGLHYYTNLWHGSSYLISSSFRSPPTEAAQPRLLLLGPFLPIYEYIYCSSGKVAQVQPSSTTTYHRKVIILDQQHVVGGIRDWVKQVKGMKRYKLFTSAFRPFRVSLRNFVSHSQVYLVLPEENHLTFWSYLILIWNICGK